jgi:hypothetical protein
MKVDGGDQLGTQEPSVQPVAVGRWGNLAAGACPAVMLFTGRFGLPSRSTTRDAVIRPAPGSFLPRCRGRRILGRGADGSVLRSVSDMTLNAPRMLRSSFRPRCAGCLALNHDQRGYSPSGIRLQAPRICLGSLPRTVDAGSRPCTVPAAPGQRARRTAQSYGPGGYEFAGGVTRSSRCRSLENRIRPTCIWPPPGPIVLERRLPECFT